MLDAGGGVGGAGAGAVQLVVLDHTRQLLQAFTITSFCGVSGLRTLLSIVMFHFNFSLMPNHSKINQLEKLEAAKAA